MSTTDRLSGVKTSVAMKAPVRVATTANIALSGLIDVDGVTVAPGDRVLVKDQTDATQNGIYDVSSGLWSRSVDFNGADEVVQGTSVFSNSGTTNAQRLYILSTEAPVIGTSALSFTTLAFTDTGTSGAAFKASDETITGNWKISDGATLGVGSTPAAFFSVDAATMEVRLNLSENWDFAIRDHDEERIYKSFDQGGSHGYYQGAEKYKAVGDGLDVIGRVKQDGAVLIPPGMYMDYAGETAPAGWLECDGSAVSRTTYADLFAAIGVMYGAGDGSTTFNLPSASGRFRRTVDGGAGVDPDAATRTDRGDGTTGDAVGTLQADENKSHTHDAYYENEAQGGGSQNTVIGSAGADSSVLTGASGGSESRPVNINVLTCIKT